MEPVTMEDVVPPANPQPGVRSKAAHFCAAA